MRLRRRRRGGPDLAAAQVRAQRLGELGFPRPVLRLAVLVALGHRPEVRRGASRVKPSTRDLRLHDAARARYRPRLRRDSSVVERILGKAEVQGSNPCRGTRFP